MSLHVSGSVGWSPGYGVRKEKEVEKHSSFDRISATLRHLFSVSLQLETIEQVKGIC